MAVPPPRRGQSRTRENDRNDFAVLGLVAVVALAAGIAVAQSDDKRDDERGGPPRMMNGHGPGMHGRAGMRGGMGMGMGGGMFLGPERILLMDNGGRLADKLDLTGTQKDKLRDIGGDLERKEIRLRADMETAGLDLRDLMLERFAVGVGCGLEDRDPDPASRRHDESGREGGARREEGAHVGSAEEARGPEAGTGGTLGASGASGTSGAPGEGELEVATGVGQG